MDIEKLREAVGYYDTLPSKEFKVQTDIKLRLEMEERLLDLARLVIEAGDEMPEELDLLKWREGNLDWAYGWNDCRDDFLAYHLKQMAKKEEEIKKAKTCDWCGSTDLICGKAWKEERTKLKERIKELEEALKSCEHNDKTQYNYSGKDLLNRFGDAPKSGRCWKTPAEIAKQALEGGR